MQDPRYYTLNGKKVVPLPNAEAWGEKFEQLGKNRIVKQQHVDGYLVSTVFLGIDHRFVGDGPPLLFETMGIQGWKLP